MDRITLIIKGFTAAQFALVEKDGPCWYCLYFCRCGHCGRACVTSMGSRSTAVGTAAPSAGHHRKRQPADLWTSRSAAWAPPAHSNLHQQLCLESRQPNTEAYEQSSLCESVYLRWAEFLSKQPDDELHQAHVIFITQRVKVGTGDDNDLLGMSIQPDGEFLQGLLHTNTHIIISILLQPKTSHMLMCLMFSVSENGKTSLKWCRSCVCVCTLTVITV